MPKRETGSSGTYVEYGSVRALWELVERTRIIEIINNAAPKRTGIPVGELTVLMAINRCLDPLAKWEIPEWYERTYLPELMGFELPVKSGYQTLTRCLDYLTDPVQQEIEMALAGRVMESFHLKPDVFLYDLTSTFVEGKGRASILQNGYSRDHRPDRKQVNYALCVTPEGVPIFHEAFPGNQVDSKTVKDTMVRFQDQHELDGCLVVDRGIVTHKNVGEIVDVRKLDLVGGMRMNKGLAKRVRAVPLDAYEEAFEIRDELLRAYELPLTIRKKPRRGLLYYSGDKAERDRKTRMAHLVEIEKELKTMAASLCRKGKGRKPTPEGITKKIDKLLEKKKCQGLIRWRFVGGRGGRRLRWERDEAAMREREQMDGKYVLITTLGLSPKGNLEVYRGRDPVERAFRIIKQVIRIRPIWNRKEEHIKAYLFICFLSYLLMSLLQLELRKVEPDLSAVKALKKLARITELVPRTIHVEGERELLGRLMRRKH
ncbi:MAG: IS1634 family transposase [Methanopyri archaeon]|jgi:transposase|nr:IS1634 family transposase [Methanopyri archaeon]|tara:strand:- start:78 stop:1538 length:1461 start_codon:yes stop_codon:yes gene_type:complete